MRVITGCARGRKLKTPLGDDIRPTADSVKEAVFNIIRDDVEGRRFLDLFAGTGQMGIEAVSRGARECVFVDSSPSSLKLVNENISLCGFQNNTSVIHADSVSYLDRCGKFDVIFIDPPYDSNMYEKVLETINSVDILSEGGIIIVEARREKVLPEMTFPYRMLKEYRYGKVKICTFTREIGEN